jgi:CHAT domain-containing protein
MQVPIRASGHGVTEAVRFFRSAISLQEEYLPAARRLHDELIAPPAIEHLHIIPGGILHYLPFVALVDDAGRYLIESYTLSTAPSATALKLSRDINPGKWKSMLLLADPDGRLPGARREVLEISRPSPNDRRVLLGEDVSHRNLAAGSYDILHFATHGMFVEREPWNSHLELHDDVLTVDEIGSLELNAYLVTLSACETALAGGLTSDVPDGDEWVGLNQAFLAAGTPTVVASLWPIDDIASSRFMVGFYDALSAAGKSAALARVQREFLRDRETAHPFYWAAFSVIGDPD